MWAFLSRRLRTWVALAVLLPLVRTVLRRGAAAAARRNPTGSSARLLGRADAALAKVPRRGRRR